MNKIINGKRYDTETAKKVASEWNGYNTRDFNYIEETLYKKKTGEYFLYGEGGANTKYSKRCDSNTWCGSSEIIPLSIKEAKRWAEKYLDADEYEEIFGKSEDKMTAKDLDVMVKRMRKAGSHITDNRYDLDNEIYNLYVGLKEIGRKETAAVLWDLYEELEAIDTLDVMKERTFIHKEGE